ncbi:hypothetical protein STEG23_026481 [Scotinomys teguina]
MTDLIVTISIDIITLILTGYQKHCESVLSHPLLLLQGILEPSVNVCSEVHWDD